MLANIGKKRLLFLICGVIFHANRENRVVDVDPYFRHTQHTHNPQK